MDGIRKPLQGITNIIRFNRHLYLLSFALIVALIVMEYFLPISQVYINIILGLAITAIVVSLIVSCYVYDFSNLYTLTWLNSLSVNKGSYLLNIHAGFDETSALLQNKFQQSNLTVLDFYNPAKHTEVSIKRARKAYPPFAGTLQVSTNTLPLQNSSIDYIFIILSAHEIRDNAERITFFKELNRVLKPNGKIIVVEHLRDFWNALAYNIGAFHFHSKGTWLQTFKGGNLKIDTEHTITPFITYFVLSKNGTAS